MRHIKDSPFGLDPFGVLELGGRSLNLLPEFGVSVDLVRHGH